MAKAAIDVDRFAFEHVASTGDEMLLPGALKYGGLPAFAALCAPGDLWLAGADDGFFDSWPQAAYGAAGAASRLELSRDPLPPEPVVDWLVEDE
ncbi:MAG TPA: hypothetical protein VHC22_33345 [Pirellulales bacterium]|nr:hypothetical protein [Pirellulales bacterium]